MKRPLAVFGGVFFGAMLVAVQLPGRGLALCAGLLTAVLVVCAFAKRLRAAGLVPLALAAALCAFLLHGGYDALLVAPRRALAGSTRPVVARVLDTRPGYGDDTVHATLQLLDVDGKKAGGMRVQVYGLAEVQVGEVIAAEMRFGVHATASMAARGLAGGYAVTASATGELTRLGTSHTLLTRMRQLQQAAGNNIRARLPQRLSGIMAAMAVGDRRTVSQAVSQSWRAAGLSHILVVSGLHLSILCGMLQAFLTFLLRPRRRRVVAGCSIAFVVLFMAFTGFTPSIVRSGLVWILLFSARLFRRKPDALTSLAVAALALLFQNPYACLDVGVQLSFSATLGTLAGGELTRRWRLARADKVARRLPVRVLERAGALAVTSLSVSLATLPVLIASELGISLFSLPMNVVAVPLVPVVVLCGLVMAVPPALPVLGWVGQPAVLLGGGLLVLAERLTAFCEEHPWAVLPIGGLLALVVVLAVYALALLAWRSRRVLACVLCGALLIPTAVLLGSALSAGTVRVQLAGSGVTASLVVSRGGTAVVLYRSRQTLSAIEDILWRNGAGRCALLVDLRQNPNSREYVPALSPARVVVAEDDLVLGALYQPMPEVEVSVARQDGGVVACVDIAGYKVAAYTGSVNLNLYAPADVLLAGSGQASGTFGALLVGGAVPAWVQDGVPLLQNAGEATLWVRPGRSVVLREVQNGADG